MRSIVLGLFLLGCSLVKAQETRYQSVNRMIAGNWQLTEMAVNDLRMPVDTTKVAADFQFRDGHVFFANTPMGNYEGFWDINAGADSVIVAETQNERDITAYKINFLSTEYLTLTYLLETEPYTFYFRRKQ